MDAINVSFLLFEMSLGTVAVAELVCEIAVAKLVHFPSTNVRGSGISTALSCGPMYSLILALSPLANMK